MKTQNLLTLAATAALIASPSAFVTITFQFSQRNLAINLLVLFERRWKKHIAALEFYRPLKHYSLNSFFLLIVFFLTFTTNIYSSVISIYTPSLTGWYNVGQTADIYPIPDLAPATYRNTQVSFSWSGSEPKYITYEISGKIREPQIVSSENTSIVNFNGSFIFDPRPGISWGSNLNNNIGPTGGIYNQYIKHDKDLGDFYFYYQFNVIDIYTNFFAWLETNKYIASMSAVFYNDMDIFSTYTDRGAVFIESARMSLSDESFSPSLQQLEIMVGAPSNFMDVSAVPEPSAMVLTILASGVMLIRRKR